MSALAIADHLLFALALFAVSTILTWCMLRVGIMSEPNDRSSHRWPVPSGGGVAIVLTFFVGFAVYYFVGGETRLPGRYLSGFAVAAIGIAAVSLMDDLGHLKTFGTKLLAQFLAGLLLVVFDIVFTRFSIPFVGVVELGWWGYPLTVVWLVALTNIFNFMDGLDGLAAGCGAIVAFFFGAVTFVEGALFVYIFCYVLLASSLGFLIFNFPRARIFMGDVGSQFLGFGFAAIAVIAAEYDHSLTSSLVMPLLFFNFIFDTTFTIGRRLLAGHDVTQAHREHLYQLMNRNGVSHCRVSLFHFAVTAAQGVGALILIQLENDARMLVFLPFLAFQVAYAAFVLRTARRRGNLV